MNMHNFWFSLLVLAVMTATPARALRLLPPQEVKGRLIGHLDRDPPIPVYGPDSIRIHYTDSTGGASSVNDPSGALTLLVATEALASAAKAQQLEAASRRHGSAEPRTLGKALAALKEWYKPPKERPNRDLVLQKIDQLEKRLKTPGAVFSEPFIRDAQELSRLVESEPNYPSSGRDSVGADGYFKTIKGEGFQGQPVDFIFSLVSGAGNTSTSSPATATNPATAR